MGTSTIPPVVRDRSDRDQGPDLAVVGTDLVIRDGEVMTYAEYRRRREADLASRSRETADRSDRTVVVER